jgi:hypothetical protein
MNRKATERDWRMRATGLQTGEETARRGAYVRPELRRLGLLRDLTKRRVSPNVVIDDSDSGGDTKIKFY